MSENRGTPLLAGGIESLKELEQFEEAMVKRIASSFGIPGDLLTAEIPWRYTVQSEWNNRFIMYNGYWLSVFDRYRRGELQPWEQLEIKQIEEAP